jgi:hypothetical protein
MGFMLLIALLPAPPLAPAGALLLLTVAPAGAALAFIVASRRLKNLNQQYKV